VIFYFPSCPPGFLFWGINPFARNQGLGSETSGGLVESGEGSIFQNAKTFGVMMSFPRPRKKSIKAGIELAGITLEIGLCSLNAT
jgi:hypothetical protein